MNKEVNFLGKAIFRNEQRKFGIKLDDRRRHTYIIGKTGMGKSELLHNMAIQDIQAGHGVGFIDSHGDVVESLLNFIPKERIKDVCYFNPTDLNFPISFNVLEEIDIEYRHLIANGLMEVFKKIWPDAWSARMEYILYNTLLALLEIPETTLLSVNRILADSDYREQIVNQLKDPIVKSFWKTEYGKYPPTYAIEASAAIQNKIGQFISAPLIRNIVGQIHSTINIRKIMDQQKIFILNLSKGKIGEDSAKLLGGLIITKLQLAAMSRVDISEKERKDFFLYVDEFQNFATNSFCNILSEARKYRLSLILAHQYITQTSEEVQKAIFGNVGTIICFRIGAEDAEYIEKEFTPYFRALDLVNLPKYHVYLKLMIDGITTKPFFSQTLPPLKKSEENFKEEIVQFCRQKYALKSRQEIEAEIAQWAGGFVIKKEKEEGISKTQIALYNAKCDCCGKWDKVPIKPAIGKPVYCKTCRQKIKKEREELIKKRMEKKETLLEKQIKSLTLENILMGQSTVFFKPLKTKTSKEEEEVPIKEEEEEVPKEKILKEKCPKELTKEKNNKKLLNKKEFEPLENPGQILNLEEEIQKSN